MLGSVHPFRFGLIAAPRGSGEQWVVTARGALDRGFGTLLVPDGLALHAPVPALATAAAAVPELRVGPYVLAAPLRPPRTAAWEAHTMTVLTGGRFEFGIGTGRPDAADDAARLGMPWGTGAQRLEQVRATIAALRELSGSGGTPGSPRAGGPSVTPLSDTPVLIAAGGPRALALAAAEADVIAFAALPTTSRAAVAAMADRVRGGARDPELAMNVNVVGHEVPPSMARWFGDLSGLPDDTLAFLRGTPREMADELLRRRDAFGVTYLAVGEAFADAFAPVTELLAGEQ